MTTEESIIPELTHEILDDFLSARERNLSAGARAVRESLLGYRIEPEYAANFLGSNLNGVSEESGSNIASLLKQREPPTVLLSEISLLAHTARPDEFHRWSVRANKHYYRLLPWYRVPESANSIHNITHLISVLAGAQIPDSATDEQEFALLVIISAAFLMARATEVQNEVISHDWVVSQEEINSPLSNLKPYRIASPELVSHILESPETAMGVIGLMTRGVTRNVEFVAALDNNDVTLSLLSGEL